MKEEKIRSASSKTVVTIRCSGNIFTKKEKKEERLMTAVGIGRKNDTMK